MHGPTGSKRTAHLKAASALGSILLLATVQNAGSQVIQDCDAPCGIELEEIAVLGGEGAAEGFIGTPRSVARLSDGRFLLADFQDQDRIKVYGPGGVYERSIGREGQGPGEYLSLAEVSRLAGDTIEVYDDGHNRLTVLSPDFEVVDTRTSGLPVHGLAMVTLPDGPTVMNQMIRTRESLGLPLHVISPDGAFTHSFGADPAIEDVRNAHAHYRRLGLASDSTIWSAHRIRYQIEEWTPEGRMLRVLTRDLPWFPPVPRGGFIDEESPPNPELGPFHVDEGGLLWTVIQRPASDWEEGLSMQPGLYGGRRLLPGNRRLYQNSVIEVIDPGTAQVVARLRTDHRIMGFVEDGLVYAYDENDAGEPMARILELTLAADPPRPPQ